MVVMLGLMSMRMYLGFKNQEWRESAIGCRGASVLKNGFVLCGKIVMDEFLIRSVISNFSSLFYFPSSKIFV